MLVVTVVVRTSMMGDAPTTVIASSSCPTVSRLSRVAMKPASRFTSDRVTF